MALSGSGEFMLVGLLQYSGIKRNTDCKRRKNMEKLYTLSEIKEAFYAEFHESGERWFCYFEEEENKRDTERAFESFVNHLTTTSN